MSPQPEQQQSHFTVFVRLPFPREDFVDPLPVKWNAEKDRVLWDVLSRPSKGKDIDWKTLAEQFDVSLQFLLQQAAWLYDRQLSQVRAQVRKVGNQQSETASPVPASISGSGAIGGQAMKRGGSNGSRVPSRLSIQQRESGQSRPDSNVPPTPTRPLVSHSRATFISNAPIQPPTRRTQSPQSFASLSRPPTRDPEGPTQSRRREYPPAASPIVPSPLHSPAPLGLDDQESSEPSSESSSSDSESEHGDTKRRGPPFKRFGKFSVTNQGDDNDEDDDSPAFLPESATEEGSDEQSFHDPKATLRQEPERPEPARLHTVQHVSHLRKISAPESSASSESSGVVVGSSGNDKGKAARQTGPISPRRAAELKASPRRRLGAREGSEGAASMGSSFSDLDDPSISDSALEEALLSNMQRGGVGSRMSTLSQVLRSKYYM